MAEGRDPPNMTGEESASTDNFTVQTRNIFKNFVVERLTSLIHTEANTGSMSVSEISPSGIGGIIRDSSRDRGSQEDQNLGKALAEMGDKLNEKYHHQFVAMIKDLGLTSNTAYATFAKVARKLFENGITWGRIVALLLFGSEIAVSVIKKGAMGIRDFLRKISDIVVAFIVQEIQQWIKDQGGWFAFLDPRKNDQNLWAAGIIAGSVVVLFAYLYINRQSHPQQ